MTHLDSFVFNLVTDKVKVNSNMFHAAMEDRIFAQISNTYVVAENQRCMLRRKAQLIVKVDKPVKFRNSRGSCTVFCFGGGASDGTLLFGALTNWIVSMKHNIG